jgi:hypothetical protein
MSHYLVMTLQERLLLGNGLSTLETNGVLYAVRSIVTWYNNDKRCFFIRSLLKHYNRKFTFELVEKQLWVKLQTWTEVARAVLICKMCKATRLLKLLWRWNGNSSGTQRKGNVFRWIPRSCDRAMALKTWLWTLVCVWQRSVNRSHEL